VISGHYAYHYTTNRHDRVSSPRVGDWMFRAARGTLEKSLVGGIVPPPWAQDLLRIARAAYLADKLSLRRPAPDRWTRNIALSVQLVEVRRWRGQAEALLTALLELLTADRWALRLQGGAPGHPGVPGLLFGGTPPEEVALFSGGLDSTAHAAERAGAGGGPLLLVSYYDPSLKPRQDRVFDAVRRLGTRRVERRAVLQQIQRKGVPLEGSSRSRGLLFLATAVYVAAAHGVEKVAVPENGQLAVNPPLTVGRAAAGSTRSVHPRTLHLVNQLIGAVGGTIQVVNPLLSDTKGEVCRRAREAGLPLPSLMRTVSCGQRPESRSASSFPECGYCYPCLIRRSGLLAGVGRDDSAYETDVWALPVDADRARHRRALAAWLANDFGLRELTTDLPLPPGADPSELLGTLLRGRAELRQLFDRYDMAGWSTPRSAAA
jgi:7-cyano-7-deazaguanine synthase in queuosine biosynthesis